MSDDFRGASFASWYVFPILDTLPRSGDIRGQSRKWSKIDRNFACLSTVKVGFKTTLKGVIWSGRLISRGRLFQTHTVDGLTVKFVS